MLSDISYVLLIQIFIPIPGSPGNTLSSKIVYPVDIEYCHLSVPIEDSDTV